MVIFRMVGWWYVSGFGYVIARIKNGFMSISNTLAVNILIKTLFAPWKQITSNNYRVSWVQKIIDNSVSRLVGFVMRFFMILVALGWGGVILILGICWIIIWPLIPFMIIVLPILTISGVSF